MNQLSLEIHQPSGQNIEMDPFRKQKVLWCVWSLRRRRLRRQRVRNWDSGLAIWLYYASEGIPFQDFLSWRLKLSNVCVCVCVLSFSQVMWGIIGPRLEEGKQIGKETNVCVSLIRKWWASKPKVIKRWKEGS